MSNLKPLPLAALFALVAFAAAAEQTTQLEEIQISGAKSQDAATGPIDGYVAERGATGTKTSTPLIETPQSISVVGAQQIRDTGAQSVVEAVRYSSGVFAQTFGADTRNDWFLIRGFPAQVSVCRPRRLDQRRRHDRPYAERDTPRRPARRRGAARAEALIAGERRPSLGRPYRGGKRRVCCLRDRLPETGLCPDICPRAVRLPQ